MKSMSAKGSRILIRDILRHAGAACLCLALLMTAVIIPAPAEGTETRTAEMIRLPAVETDPQSPTGLKTTWSCVYFGAYPSSEVADSGWNSVDS